MCLRDPLDVAIAAVVFFSATLGVDDLLAEGKVYAPIFRPHPLLSFMTELKNPDVKISTVSRVCHRRTVAR